MKREPSWFNVAENFGNATQKALETQAEVFERLSQRETWAEELERAKAEHVHHIQEKGLLAADLLDGFDAEKAAKGSARAPPLPKRVESRMQPHRQALVTCCLIVSCPSIHSTTLPRGVPSR